MFSSDPIVMFSGTQTLYCHFMNIMMLNPRLKNETELSHFLSQTLL